MRTEEHLLEFDKLFAYPSERKRGEAVMHLRVALLDLRQFARADQRDAVDRYLADPEPKEELHYLMHLVGERLLKVSSRKSTEKLRMGV